MEWWIAEVVSEMKADMRDSGTVTGIITGRRGEVRDRVQQLIVQAKLRPSFLCFHDDVSRGDVFARKCTSLRRLLEKYPTVVELEVWEDRQGQLEAFADIADRRWLNYSPHLVTVLEGMR